MVISGTDQSGNVNVTLGTSPVVPGYLVQVNFGGTFTVAPKSVVVTPSVSGASAFTEILYATTPTTSGFQVYIATTPGGSHCSFNYVVM